jgi:alpha-ketoglutarate-dependent taurine dioxygenase
VTAPGPRRRGPRKEPTALVSERTRTDQPFVLEITANVPDLDLASWLTRNRDRMHDELRRCGVVLLRGFAAEDPAGFGRAVRALSPELLGYLERAAPRTEIADKVFTSTEFSQDQWIPLHHEMSYSHNWPSLLYFYCCLPAAQGGATPLASERTVTPLIPPEVRDRCVRSGVRYLRNYGPDLDLPWQEVFQTTDRAEVEAYCATSRTEYAWVGRDGLRTYATRQAMSTHPRTGERVWFNHAHLFHVSNMPPEVAAALIRELGPEGLPRNAFYGDGAPIEDEAARLIRALYQEAAVQIPWQAGDVLVVDNFLAAHGRAPFRGDRQVLVAMSDLYVNREMA